MTAEAFPGPGTSKAGTLGACQKLQLRAQAHRPSVLCLQAVGLWFRSSGSEFCDTKTQDATRQCPVRICYVTFVFGERYNVSMRAGSVLHVR